MSVATDAVHGQAWCEISFAGIETHPIFIDQAHHADDLIDFIAMAELLLTHVTTGGVRHLIVLQMKLG